MSDSRQRSRSASFRSRVLGSLGRELDRERTALMAILWAVDQPRFDRPPARGGWSIGEIAHHLVLAERSITRGISLTLDRHDLGGLPEEDAVGSPPVTDIDRATYALPARAPSFVAPTAKLPKEVLLADLVACRGGLWDVMGRFDGRDVRTLTFPHFLLGPLNLYQWLTLIAVHEARHRAQIESRLGEGMTPGGCRR